MEIEKIQSFSAKYYDNKIKNDLEFYAKEKKRVTEIMKNRFATDEEYSNKIKKKRNHTIEESL